MSRDRYRRQTLVEELNQKGQELLAKKHAIVIGAGGLGSNSANLLVRMGIGSIDIIDDDIVDITNLHRTSVFSELDIGKSKALIIQQRLQPVNTMVHVKGINQKVTPENIESLVRHADVIIDGTDNIPLRLLINETSIQNKTPWVYAGVYGTVGMVMGILPKKTPCFQCITQNIPDLSTHETPVLGSLPAAIAAIQSNEAIKVLLGRQPSGLIIYDVWNQCFDTLDIKRNPYCPMCGNK
ncbi:MAG TPA: HesA/MoeB/ThiF family protein [Candidatus Thermoplasmatota archaeon]|nr:HesA/MoeB/ThiF family protein [Candidatus Thermoplasmatota archaeon]